MKQLQDHKQEQMPDMLKRLKLEDKDNQFRRLMENMTFNGQPPEWYTNELELL